MRFHKNFVSALIITAILLFLIPRFNGFFTHDFPAMDGGLFNTIIKDIEHANFRLPKFTTYNNDAIPFAYPPLSFCFLALLHSVTQVEIITLQRVVPLVITLLYVFAFYRFTSTLFTNRNHALIITLCFVAIPHSYIWMLVGGGISRALGFFFAITALWLQRRTFQTGNVLYRIGTIIGVAGTFSSHPEWAVFLIANMMFFAFVGSSKTAQVRETIFVILVAIVLISPWWLTVISYHGIEPFISPATATLISQYWRNLSSLNVFWLDPRDPLLIAGILGLLFSLLGRPKYIAVWFLFLTFVNVRSALAYTNAPLAFAAGLAWIKGWHYVREQKSEKLLYILLILAFGQTFYLNSKLNLYRMYFLSPIDRKALAWVKQNTPGTAKFLVLNDLSGDAWSTDVLREWFPTLAERTSITTVQGYEWKANQFKRRIAWNNVVFGCIDQTLDCLEQWSQSVAQPFTHIYLLAVDHTTGMPCCANLISSLNSSTSYEKIYEEESRIIWKLTKPLSGESD